MNESIDPTQLDQSALQSLLGGSSPSLIPESLITTLTIGFIVLNILGILFLVFYVVSLIRKWKVESAVFHMQKDLADIKAALSQSTPQPVQQTPPAINPVIAATDTSSEQQPSSSQQS